jgi:hypothetical protein
MTRNGALLSVFLGCGLELIAILGEQFYYLRGPYFALGRPAPLWFGRLLSGLIGLGFLILGFRYFFLGY